MHLRPSTPRPRSGERVDIAFHDYAASFASVGATLRSLSFAGRDLVVPFDADGIRPYYRGAVLAPWPNRVVDGRYTSADGAPQQLALTEPTRGHALHGLTPWLDFAIAERTETSVSFAATVPAQAGYPHEVAVLAEFHLDSSGLHCRISARNDDVADAPIGLSMHPYLVAGPGLVDDWTLEMTAATVLDADERLTPTGLHPVESQGFSQFDFRSARRIADLELDHAFTDLHAAGGEHVARVLAADGTGVELRWDLGGTWLQVHTADLPADPPNHRVGLAVEPMTCAPDAFNSDLAGVLVTPGESISLSFSISAV